jgi:hypothetical protein
VLPDPTTNPIRLKGGIRREQECCDPNRNRVSFSRARWTVFRNLGKFVRVALDKQQIGIAVFIDPLAAVGVSYWNARLIRMKSGFPLCDL